MFFSGVLVLDLKEGACLQPGTFLQELLSSKKTLPFPRTSMTTMMTNFSIISRVFRARNRPRFSIFTIPAPRTIRDCWEKLKGSWMWIAAEAQRKSRTQWRRISTSQMHLLITAVSQTVAGNLPRKPSPWPWWPWPPSRRGRRSQSTTTSPLLTREENSVSPRRKDVERF